MPRLIHDSGRWFWPLVVVLSLLVNLLQVPVLHGTFGALVVAVLTQVYLPGYLLARRLGRHRLPHPIHRFGWVLACGLGFSIVMAAPFRLFEQAIPVYLIILHIVMFLLAIWFDGKAPSDEPDWQWNWSRLPSFALVALCSVIAMGVSYESRYRFYGFEDQPIFISYIDWLVHHPGVRPVPETPLRSRQVAVISADSRMDTDGWTYNHAAWSWVSGVDGAQLIWYDLATLFIWSVPLITFALAYEITRKETTAIFSSAALTIAGLLTLDNLVYAPNYVAYGRFVLFQINVPRQASLTLTLPLALLTAFAYLRTYSRRDLLMMGLSALAVAIMHPIQFMILAVSLGAVGLARLIAAPRLITLRQFIPMGIVLGLILALPYIQRSTRVVDMNEDVLTVVRPNLLANPNSLANQYFVMLPELPILGQTYIRRPETVFYNPVITLAIILALLYGLRWRSTPLRQYIFAATLISLFLFFTPGLTRLFDRIVSSVGILTAMFTIPVALIYGQVLDDVTTWASRRMRGYLVQPVMLLMAAVLMVVLVIEPFPIPASARDQLNAYNAMQEPRRMLESQAAASQALVTQLPAAEISIIATPRDIANFMIEDTPNALITGGRSNANRSIAANDRFFGEGNTNAPWLDSLDLEFLSQWGVTDMLALTDWTRLAQLHLQPERFERLGTVNGYILMRVPESISADETDTRFARMNELYAAQAAPRWSRSGFVLVQPGSPEVWTPVVDEWTAALREEPANDRARLGLAFAQTLSGDDLAALETWEALFQRYPDIPLYADAVASTRANLGIGDATAPLIESLDSSVDYVRVLAARRLLSEPFFYRLDAPVLERVVSLTEQDAITWERLADFDQPDAVRARAGLLLYRGDTTTALKWLQRIPRIRLSPEDLTVMAAINLSQGDLSAALATLAPATDPDWVRPNANLHAERWANNTAAALYEQLVRDRQLPPDTLPDSHPLRLLNVPSIHVFDANVMQSEDEQSLLVTATFGDYRPRTTFPIQTWRVYVVSADGLTEYARVDTPAVFPDGPLTRATLEVSLPPGIPPLTSAQVIIEPRYNNAVTVTPLRQNIVLNRPVSVDLPAGATPEQAQFGGVISLRGTFVQSVDEAVTVDLYWQADAPVSEDYQVFIHVFDAAGNRVVQRDSGPVDSRYPTSQWRIDTLIADPHVLGLDQPLPAGDYTIRIGLYRLSDGMRVSITGADERVQDNSLLIGTFSR
ncbi:MAG TPA: hypothetical protein PLQ56_07745 [Aggregatilineales bacterium]|nr:hypothetical protein [Aggregatilineales bacterium]